MLSTESQVRQISHLKLLTAIWDVAGSVQANSHPKNFNNDDNTEKLPMNSSPTARAHMGPKALIFSAIFFVSRDSGTTYQGPCYWMGCFQFAQLRFLESWEENS